MEILFAFIKLYYLFTFGVMTGPHSLAVYEVPMNDFVCMADFESTIAVCDVFFITGQVKVFSYEREFLKVYDPYQLEFYINVGIKVGQIKIGYKHGCIHPMFTYVKWNGTKHVKYEGSVSFLYFTCGRRF